MGIFKELIISCWLVMVFLAQVQSGRLGKRVTDLEKMINEVKNGESSEPVFLDKYACISPPSKTIGNSRVTIESDEKCIQLCKDTPKCVAAYIQVLDSGLFCWLKSKCWPAEGEFQNTRLYYLDRTYLLEQLTLQVTENAEKINTLEEMYCVKIKSSVGDWFSRGKEFTDVKSVKYGRIRGFLVCTDLPANPFIAGIQINYGDLYGELHGRNTGSLCKTTKLGQFEFVQRIKGKTIVNEDTAKIMQISFVTNLNTYTFGKDEGKPFDAYAGGEFLAYIAGKTLPTGVSSLDFYFYC